MNARLPDVAVDEPSAVFGTLDEVGMSGIDLPLTLVEPDALSPVQARAEVYVDLARPQVKGIHMSRLHTALDAFAADRALTPRALLALMEQCVASHETCDSRKARLGLSFDLTLRRPALVTPGLGGWRSYPVRVDARWDAGTFEIDTWVTVTYSSTCPCSAALSRQRVQQAFSARFPGTAAVSAQDAADWLRDHASLATPHSQRSVALIGVRLHGDTAALALRELVELAESALGTPVQTAVKRADEQAFATLNGQNLMYVEDAARRLQQALADRFDRYCAHVTHQESLHAHDAVARVSRGWQAR